MSQAGTVVPGQEDGTPDVTITVDGWIKPTQGPSAIELSGIADPDTISQPSWEIGRRRLLVVPRPSDLRFTPAEGSPTGKGTDGGPTLKASIQTVKTELEKGLRTPCPSAT